MKRKILIVIISLLLVSIATAGILINFSKDVELSKEQKTALSNIDITSPTTSSLICDTYTYMCRAKLTDTGLHTDVTIPKRFCSDYDINESICLEYTDYTNNELQTLLEEAVELRLIEIADVTIQRQTEPEIKLGEGTFTIKEKK